jgi:hypothetical protein
MSQSATLYRISQDTFKQLDKPDNKQKFDINSAKSYSIFQGSFMALEYILSKGQSNSTTELVTEIFNPKHSLGERFFESLSPEEQLEFYESGLFIPYLNPSTISQLNDLIEKIPSLNISSKYNAKELNDNGIYPRVWHNDNSPDQAYNERQVLEDFEELKTLIKQASTEQDYIFVFVG